MKKEQYELDDLLTRVDEMREFFRFGGEVIPFLANLFTFLQGVMPLMLEVSNSIKDSTHKLPTATDRIVDVSNSTELATNEIMDKLDNITEKLNKIAASDSAEHKSAINGINDDINGIIYALQFQDITSQKLEHANRILTAIHDKFSALFDSLEAVKSNSDFGSKIISVMDPKEEMEKRQQGSAEFDKKTVDRIRASSISQDDIDSLFD